MSILPPRLPMSGDLTPEERQKIYEEEKARAEARDKVAADKEADKTRKGCLGCLALVIGIPALIFWGCPS